MMKEFTLTIPFYFYHLTFRPRLYIPVGSDVMSVHIPKPGCINMILSQNWRRFLVIHIVNVILFPSTKEAGLDAAAVHSN